MIQALSKRFTQPIAFSFLLMFYTQLVLPLRSLASGEGTEKAGYRFIGIPNSVGVQPRGKKLLFPQPVALPYQLPEKKKRSLPPKQQAPVLNSSRDIGGPSSPETSTFKPVGSDNLVNLFTGDFSYSVPLLDVGGYPVNLFYNGGIAMEQEASWVGLGWNINPGSVNRNMRGVPDDFDGTDMMKQVQNVKPNKTWGGEVGFDGETFGIKEPSVNFTMGFSYNNYLGPELELGAGVSVSIPITKSIVHEKTAPNDSVQGLNLSLGANAKLNSRSGLTLSPSLNAGLHTVSQKMDLGVGLSTSYNSRTGIKDLNLTSQVTLNRYAAMGKDEYGDMRYQRFGASASLTSSTISFARPSYVPTLRMPMQYSNYSGQLEAGGGMFGLRGAGTIQGYYSESKVASTTILKPLVGFMYLEKANGRKDAVMDFNRVNDGEVTPNTPVISAPQYDYDIFNIQGEGTGGSIRAYRGDLGFMKDNETTSRDNNISIGFDIAPPGHYGGNWNVVSSPTRSGGWDDPNNTLNQTLNFRGPQINTSFENIYFRNPGEATVANEDMINRIGRDNLVRFKLGGSFVTPRLESQLEQFSRTTNGSLGIIPVANPGISTYQQRDRRTQVITMLDADDAGLVGLDKQLKSYLPYLNADNTLKYDSMPRVSDYRKGHHISEITVLEQSGMRYVYGIPVYNTTQQDFTFSVKEAADADNLVKYIDKEATTGSDNITGKTGIDGYVSIQQTPAYASSFLISGLLSPDYVDVTGNGITEDDLGTAVKFNYTKSAYTYKWSTPRKNTDAAIAHFNAGLRTERKDNKATVSYGEREAWYMHSIESKSMIAVFKTSPRNDAKSVNGINANSIVDVTIKNSENASLKLDSILLYTKADIKANGLAGAVPLKTVHFEYSYTLCNGTPDNAAGGKLTLKDIYFTFNGQARDSKNRYVFDYGDLTSKSENPDYAYNASDRWGTYKPAKDPVSSAALNPGGLSNVDYPYTSTDKTKDDAYAGAWSLKKILLPSGGQIEVQYEADDYAYVQNRRACNMFKIYGFGNTTNYTQNNSLYTVVQNEDQNYVYVQLSEPLQGKTPADIKKEIAAKYLDSLNQLAFRLTVNMPKGTEPLTMYANYDDYGLCANSSGSTVNPVIYIRLRQVNSKGALANSSVQFLINSLPGQAFKGYDLSEDNGLQAFFDLIVSELTTLKGAFENAEGVVRSAGGGSTVSLDQSFVRLCAPGFFKYGGGHRVKRVLLKDNWNAMSGQYTSQYGQDYDYTTTKMVNGVSATISSGVASYEPGIGSEENPFREILQYKDKLPLASAQYGAIEMPVLEGLYPSPVVGYSKVTVRSIHRNGTHHDSVVRSAIGKQVTEFYTAKDYPSFSVYTPMNNMDYHSSKPFSFLYKETIDRRTTSQGFLVETNDMHGKMKAQTVYSEGDEKTPLSFTYHWYKNTGANGLNDKVDFVRNDQSGAVVSGNMGIDAELMTDVREFDVITKGNNGQAQVDFLSFIPPAFSVIPYMLKSYTENKYKAVTTTKLINFHAIEDSVLVNDKGSVVSTKTVAYDAETGSPIVSKTVNEFNDTVFNVSYPAYWAYSGLSPAYKNINRIYAGVSFVDGRITTGVSDMNAFESGDELFAVGGNDIVSCPAPSANVAKLWVVDKNKNTTALTVPAAKKDLVFLDSAGNLFTKFNVVLRIIRSGKRNNIGATVGSVTAMKNPVRVINGMKQLSVDNSNDVISTSAVVYKEKWQNDKDIFPRYKTVNGDGSTGPNLIYNGNFSSGATGFTSSYINSYGQSNGNDKGKYFVTTDPSGWNSSAFSANCGDHTTPNVAGNMMAVDGSTQSNQIVWAQTVSVQPNTIYNFSAWAQSIHNSTNTSIPTATLIFKIGNTALPGALYPSTSKCNWRQYQTYWNSGSNTSATITITDTETSPTGNDFALDDISLSKFNSPCDSWQVMDCSGDLETHINPYTKGLVGNYKPYRSYIYYGSRKDSDLTAATAIRKNGYIANFSNYWSFDANNNLVPDNTNPKWVWNSELTKINAHGQELETRDALNRYTAAQYAYDKNLPVAMTSNSGSSEAAYEGFEDNGFTNNLNKNDNLNCPDNRHIDLSASGYIGSVVDTKSTAFAAHTGSKVLKIEQGQVLSKTFAVSASLPADYSISFLKDTVQTLDTTGANFDTTSIIPSNCLTDNSLTTVGVMPQTTGSDVQSNFYVQYPFNEISNNHYKHTYEASWDSYINLTEAKEYSFSLSAHSNYLPSSFDTVFNYSNKIDVDIEDESGKNVYSASASYSSTSGNGGTQFPVPQEAKSGFSKFLCKGIYHVKARCKEIFSVYTTYLNSTDSYNDYYWECSNCNSPLYKSLEKVNGCIYTKPVAASDSMTNAIFTIPSNKKMLFSAWVHENCTSGTPCAFTNTKVEIKDQNYSVIKSLTPVGPIIEGWQRYEGDFTMPSASTSCTVNFINSGTQPVYFDDIRILPFNANMKSYVYNPRTLRLSAELDENNYATFYDYDEEGQLIRVKKETVQGIKTIQETRSAKQKAITTIQ